MTDFGSNSGNNSEERVGTNTDQNKVLSVANGRSVPKVCILGIGQMGLVCAGALTSPDPHGVGNAPRAHVVMWGYDSEENGVIAQTRKTDRLPGFELPASVRIALSDQEALADADIIVNAIPVQFIRSTWERLKEHVPNHANVISVAKGIENSTLLRPTQIIADVLKDDPDGKPRAMGCMSGPAIATELAACLPATMAAASDHPGFAQTIQELFSTSWLRIYTNPDLLGVELAGATKNVIAIAAGIIDGLGAGYNAKSALLARGLAEIGRLGSAMGAETNTFFGIAGVGDLATTCFSPEGRNRSCGEALGKGEKLDQYLRESMCVVEGVATTESVVDLAKKYKVDMPITDAVYAVLFEHLDPVDAITMLMSRDLREEQIG
ncbi:MAG: NAD(P)-dependent glycerol-3-phosphate dehydrogenase [Phycisphaerales bacterium]|nr:NAD(P)-dependent glycerol-3-phosphate dehydrogenase [Phycisphaerales bacterium]